MQDWSTLLKLESDFAPRRNPWLIELMRVSAVLLHGAEWNPVL